MKNNWIKMAVAAAAIVSFTGVVQAIPITGNIGFSGAVNLDSTTAATATEVTSWVNPTAASPSGSFVGLVNSGDAFTVTGGTPWSFNSSAVSDFWSIDGFQFDLSSSTILQQGVLGGFGFATVELFGTVSGNGFDVTPFIGTFQVGDPSSGGGPEQFTERLSFTSVPDGGTTVMLLGGALMGLGLLKRKLSV